MRYSERNLLIVAALCILGPFLFGYDQGSTSYVLKALHELNTYYNSAPGSSATSYYSNVADDYWMRGFFVTASSIGAVLTYIVLFFYGNDISKRTEMMVAGALYFFGSLLLYVSADFVWTTQDSYYGGITLIIWGRLVYGAGIACSFHSVPQYLADISPNEIRGQVTTTVEVGILVGAFAGVLTGYICSTKTGSYWVDIYRVSMIIGVVMVFTSAYLPQSISHMLSKGKPTAEGRKPYIDSELLDALKYIYPDAILEDLDKVKKAHVQDTEETRLWRKAFMTSMKHGEYTTVLRAASDQVPILAVENAMGSNNHTIADESVCADLCLMPAACNKACEVNVETQVLLTDPVMRLCIWLACSVKLLETLSGKGALLYNGMQVFEAINSEHASLHLMICTLVQLGAIVFMVVVVETAPRRTWFMWGTGTMAASLFFFLIFQPAKVTPLALTCIYFFIFGFEISFGALSWTLVSEIFPHFVRSAANGLATTTLLLFSALMTFLVAPMQKAWGIVGLAAFFFCFCLLSTVLFFFFLPETRGINMEKGHRQVEAIFDANLGYLGFKKAKRSLFDSVREITPINLGS